MENEDWVVALYVKSLSSYFLPDNNSLSYFLNKYAVVSSPSFQNDRKWVLENRSENMKPCRNLKAVN